MLRRIEPRFVERVWGARDLGPWFPVQPANIGEVWFQTEPPLPLLVKFIFAEDRLSVQVHPNDEQARLRGLSNGKTEMWHVLRAAPGATIALGLRQERSEQELRAAAQSGAIEHDVNLVPVTPGDTFVVEAGTIHALGAGVTIVEIQQNSDTTYRLYDYGRPRELHLDDGLAVARRGPWSPSPVTAPGDGPWRTIASSAYFVTRLADLAQPWAHPGVILPFELFIITHGHGRIGAHDCREGQVWLADRTTGPFEIEPVGQLTAIRTSPPR